MRLTHRPAATEESHESENLHGVCANVLIPGRGDPIQNGAVVIKAATIEWVGGMDDLPSKYSKVAFTKVPVVLPGLWDCHVHYGGTNVVGDFSNNFIDLLPGTQALIGAVTVDDLRATLMAGITSVRELSGYAGDLRPAVESGRIVGPHVYPSIAALSITGGHGDMQELPIQTVQDACAHGGYLAVCDGPDECTRTVRRMIRRGAKVIKLCSTGGVLSLHDRPEDAQFSPEELRAIVAEAARAGLAVAAHAIGKQGIVAALEAGVATVEHGMYLDGEVAALMRQKGAILVPTRHIVESFAADDSELPPALRAKLRPMVGLSRESYRLAVREGVRVALGTDTYSSDRAHRCAHGSNARELYWATVAGMTPLQAIEAATATAPETLGPQAPRSGQLREGFDADLIAVAMDPLEDIRVLADNGKHVTHVWKGGKLYKSP